MDLKNKDTNAVRLVDLVKTTVRNARLVSPRFAVLASELYNKEEAFLVLEEADIVNGKHSVGLNAEIEALGRALTALGFSRRNSDYRRNWDYYTFSKSETLKDGSPLCVLEKSEGKGKNKVTKLVISDDKTAKRAIGFFLVPKPRYISEIENKAEPKPEAEKPVKKSRSRKPKPEAGSEPVKIEADIHVKPEAEPVSEPVSE